jgi:hypothetical protein
MVQWDEAPNRFAWQHVIDVIDDHTSFRLMMTGGSLSLVVQVIMFGVRYFFKPVA